MKALAATTKVTNFDAERIGGLIDDVMTGANAPRSPETHQ